MLEVWNVSVLQPRATQLNIANVAAHGQNGDGLQMCFFRSLY